MNDKITAVMQTQPDGLKVKKERNLSLDVIRILCFSMVVYTHFFLYTGFYRMDIWGPKAYIMTVIRSLGISCIPMFIFLTGFLFKNRQLDAKYYSGIKNTLITYVFASGFCYAYDCLHTETEMSFGGFLKGLLSFSSAKYSWYIEMYIGLFLLIPFLNIIWKNLPEKKHRIILILTLAFLTLAPQLINTFVFDVEGWWQQPMISEDYYLIVPEWWEKIFPLTYYFTGCYIREYGIKINKWLNLALIILLVFGLGTYNYYRSAPGTFVKGEWQNNASPIIYLLGILVFVFIYNLNIKFKSKWLSKPINIIAELTLGAYLVSCVFDGYIYEEMKRAMFSSTVDFKYLWVTAPLIIVLSLAVAFVINLITKLILKAEAAIVKLVKSLAEKVKPQKQKAAVGPKAPAKAPLRQNKKAPQPAPPVRKRRPVAPAECINTERPATSSKPVSAQVPVTPAEPLKREVPFTPITPSPVMPRASAEPLYKSRVNTYDDEGVEVLVVEDRDRETAHISR
ncbi:MAG: acyltransferase family protein [Clostridia bacterium]|nr:acyltransferase family protein [Clostridia bacterium]